MFFIVNKIDRSDVSDTASIQYSSRLKIIKTFSILDHIVKKGQKLYDERWCGYMSDNATVESAGYKPCPQFINNDTDKYFSQNRSILSPKFSG